VRPDHFSSTANAVGWMMLGLVGIGGGYLVKGVMKRVRRRRKFNHMRKWHYDDRTNLIIWDDLTSDKPMSPKTLETMRAWADKDKHEPYDGSATRR
jgi:hypothetical protein